MSLQRVWVNADFDGCECGDYRWQHERGEGRCTMPNDLTHGFRPCEKFRLYGPPATEIPAPYLRREAQ